MNNLLIFAKATRVKMIRIASQIVLGYDSPAYNSLPADLCSNVGLFFNTCRI